MSKKEEKTGRRRLSRNMMHAINIGVLILVIVATFVICRVLDLKTQEKRDYFRFQDGSFLDLRGLDEWQTLAQAVSEADEGNGRDKDEDLRPLAMYRAAYLNALVEKNRLPVSVSDALDMDLPAVEECASSMIIA